MKRIFKNSLGFTMVGALVASSIGAVAVVGLARLSSTIINTLNKSRKDTNIMELSQDIKRAFQAGYDPECNTHDPSEKCWNACSSSLIGYSTTSGGSISIKAPDPLPNPSPLPPGITAGQEIYKGGGIYKGIRIQQIRYVPSSIPNRADVTVHFSISDDTRETLTAPRGLHFGIFIDERFDNGTPADLTDDTIKECTVASAEITGSGAIGIVKDCRKVGPGKTLVGCGGTAENTGSKVTAFGYRAGKDEQNSTGGSGSKNSFLGYETGRKNEGDENIFIGYKAGWENKEGKGNLFLGYEAGKDNTKGIYNVVIGHQTNVGGAEERDRLNIAKVIEGTFRNPTKSPPLHPNPSLPEVTFKKGPVQIDPPPYATTTDPGLEILGEIHIEKKQTSTPRAKVKIQADGTGASPTMKLIADALKIQRYNSPAKTVELKVENTAVDPELHFVNTNLQVKSEVTSPSEPGLDLFGKLQINNRTSSSSIEIWPESSGTTRKLIVPGNLEVTKKGKITQDLEISKNLEAKTGDFNKYDNILKVTNSSKFNTLRVQETGYSATMVNVRITTANITNTASMNIAGISNLDGRDGNPSHTHTDNSHGNNSPSSVHLAHHNARYSPIGHGHPPFGSGGGRNCTNCPVGDRVCPCNCSQPPCCPSSRILKRNIKPFKDYEKSLNDISVTPLFTYQYKEDTGNHPEKPRMGIIAEELPKDLQILGKGKPSNPDWLSIYGTLWAGIKAFAKQLEDFKKENAVKLTELSGELKTWLADQMDPLEKEINAKLEDLKSQTAEAEKALAKHSKEAAGATRDLSELKKQLQKDLLPLQENWREELKKTQGEMEATQKQLKQNLSFHPAKKPSLEARSR